MSKSTVTVLLIGIIILASGLRLYGLDRQSMWYDEAFEETAFQRLFLGYQRHFIPSTPPLHSFFVYVVTKMYPRNDFALRLIPFAFGVISVPLLFFLGRKLFDEKVGLISSFLLAISPFHIWYSQEARMYALQWMLALISLIYFMRTLEHQNRHNYIGYVTSTVAGLYTIQITLFLIVLQALYLLFFIKEYKRQIYKWIVAFSAVVILYLPWIIYYIKSSIEHPSGAQKWTNLITILAYTVFAYFVGFSIGPSLRELHLGQSLAIMKPYLPEILSIMTIYCTLIILGLWYIRKNHPRLIFLILLQTVPIIGVLLINKIMPHIAYNVRYTGTALFGFVLSVALGVNWLSCVKSRIPGKALSILAMVVITGFSAYSYANYQFNPKYHKEDVRTAASYIKEHKKDGDVILVITSTCALPLNRYLDKDLQSIGYPPLNANDKEEVIRELKKIVRDKKRIWLVLCREYVQRDLTKYTKTWLDTKYTEIKELYRDTNEIPNLKIFCYDLTTKTT